MHEQPLPCPVMPCAQDGMLSAPVAGGALLEACVCVQAAFMGRDLACTDRAQACKAIPRGGFTKAWPLPL